MPKTQKQLGKSKKVPPQLKGWLEVVAQVRKANSNLPYKEVLKKAQVEYKKVKKRVGV